MGIIGTFEGWVPSPQDLYYNGVNSGELTLNTYFCVFENTRIKFIKNVENTGGAHTITIPNAIDVKSYSRLIFEGAFCKYNGNNNFVLSLVAPNNVYLASSSLTAIQSYFVELDISQVTTIPATSSFVISNLGTQYGQLSYITRIRLE